MKRKVNKLVEQRVCDVLRQIQMCGEQSLSNVISMAGTALGVERGLLTRTEKLGTTYYNLTEKGLIKLSSS